MTHVRQPGIESARLAALYSLGILNSDPDPVLDALARTACLVCDVPFAMITLIDGQRQWVKAQVGLQSAAPVQRDQTICTQTILQNDILIIPDVALDAHFATHPMVVGPPGLRFYAGVPLCLEDGSKIGTLCVMHTKTHSLTKKARATLWALAESAAAALSTYRFLSIAKQAEHALRAGEAELAEARRTLAAERQRLATTVDSTGVGTWDWHVPSNNLRVSPLCLTMLGFSPDAPQEMSGTLIADALHPEDAVTHARALAGHFDTDMDHHTCDIRLRHRDGHWVHVHSRAAAITRRADGTPDRVFGIWQDITAVKAKEAAYHARGDLLEQTSRLAGVGGWAFDLASETLEWTDATYRIHQLPAGTPIDVERAIGFYTPEAQPVIRNAIEHSIKTGESWDLELPMRRADGSLMWARTIGAFNTEGSGPGRLSGVIQDISDTMAKRQALDEANERIALATESSGICIWDWDLTTDHIVWAPQMFALYGLQPVKTTMVLAHWLSMLHPEDRNEVLDALHAAISNNETYIGEFRIIRPEGTVRYLRGQARVAQDAAGQPVRMLGANWDITDSRKLAASLADQHELMRVTLRSIGDGVITTDAHGVVQWLNPVAERLCGWTSAEAEGQRLETVFNIRDETTGKAAANPVQVCLAEGFVVGLGHETVLMRRGGGEFGVEDSAAPIRNDQGNVLGAVLVFHDVSEQRRLSGEMNYRASHDALTGLVNRSEFETRLGWLLHMAKSDKSENAVLYIDLDEFKIINDTCGHAAGDQVLRQMGKLLGEVVRASDTLARLGGDEFAIILDNCTETSALRLAERICERMENFRFMFHDRRFRIGASIGLVAVDERWPSTEAIMQAADISCYAAKEGGRNRVHRWCDSDQSINARHGEMQWTGRIEQALEEDRFELFAQRIEPLDHTHDGIHAEILLRLRDTDGTLIGPSAFLPAAERYHMAPRIDRWVLTRALAWMAKLPPLKPGVVDTICVNLSGQSVGDSAFHTWANERLSEAGPAVCSRLCLEITETVAITNLSDAARFVDRVQTLGVRVALDDFGAGAASFGYLKYLPVNYLKIDGQFIRDLVSDRLDEASVRCFADVARVAGLLTVAECVDHPDTLAKLRAMGIDFAQGFLMNRPAPINELLLAAPTFDHVIN